MVYVGGYTAGTSNSIGVHMKNMKKLKTLESQPKIIPISL